MIEAKINMATVNTIICSFVVSLLGIRQSSIKNLKRVIIFSKK